ncbi:hypothetical protein WDU94_000333 [Cyamophila willieti]
MDMWGIYAHLLTPKRKIKWTPNIMKHDFDFDHQHMFDPTEENTVWILPATKSLELFSIEDPYSTTKSAMFVPPWLRGEGLDPKKRGRGGVYNIDGKEYKEWEVPVKYRSLSPDMLSKYYMNFDKQGRRIEYNRTLPAKWATAPYALPFTYKLEITNDDGSINKTIWKRNQGYITKPDGSMLLIRDLSPQERLKYLGSLAQGTHILNFTNVDGSFNSSRIVAQTPDFTTFPTQWINFTGPDGSFVKRLWKYVKPKFDGQKPPPTPKDPNLPTEIVAFTYPNGSFWKNFWKYVKTRPADPFAFARTDPNIPDDVAITPRPYEKEQPAFAFAQKTYPHVMYEIVTYPDGALNYTTRYTPALINRTAPDGSFLFSYFYVPKFLRQNASTTDNVKLITNKLGSVIKKITYRPKLFHLFTHDDGSLNYSEKVSDFNQVKQQYYTNMRLVDHKFPNGSVERTQFAYEHEFTTPSIRKYFGHAETQIMNFTNLEGRVLGTFWKIVKHMGQYTGTGNTVRYTLRNRYGHSTEYWRELPPFTTRDFYIKENDTTDLVFVTRRDGFVYGSFKKIINKNRVFTTPIFRPYTGNLSTTVGYYRYPNGSIYGSHWQVVHTLPNREVKGENILPNRQVLGSYTLPNRQVRRTPFPR